MTNDQATVEEDVVMQVPREGRNAVGEGEHDHPVQCLYNTLERRRLKDALGAHAVAETPVGKKQSPVGDTPTPVG